MKLFKEIILFFIIFFFSSCSKKQYFDVIVVGGGAGGTSAAIESARNGVKTLLLEETTWLGGMLTSAGVSAIDGNFNLPSGFWGEYRDSLVLRYGSIEKLKTGWVSNVLFEPKVGNAILNNIANNEKENLKILFSSKIIDISKSDKNFQINSSSGRFVSKVLIDATELGDILPMLSEEYSIGMDSKTMYNEDIAPDTKNNIIQDFTYVMILKDYGYNVKINEPENYNVEEFFCSTLSKNCPESDKALWSPNQMMEYGRLPNNKIMINWPIYGNDYYSNLIEMNNDEREIVIQKAKKKSLRFLYYIQNELGFNNYSISDDEFPSKDNFPLIPYYRESRRVKGKSKFSLNYITKPYSQKDKLYRTGVLVGDYPIDHHHDEYDGITSLPKLSFYPIPSYTLPIGSIIPDKTSNLLMGEKSISVSNIVNGTTRLQPVVMQIGQVAGLIASESIKTNKSTHEVDIRVIQKKILNKGGYIQPFLDVDKKHPHFKAFQRIGSTGILRGTGLNVGWSNQTWFYPEKNVDYDLFIKDISDYLNTQKFFLKSMNLKDIFSWIQNIKNNPIDFLKDWKELGLENYDTSRDIKRGELAVILDYYLNPFEKKINFSGEIIER